MLLTHIVLRVVRYVQKDKFYRASLDRKLNISPGSQLKCSGRCE